MSAQSQAGVQVGLHADAWMRRPPGPAQGMARYTVLASSKLRSPEDQGMYAKGGARDEARNQNPEQHWAELLPMAPAIGRRLPTQGGDTHVLGNDKRALGGHGRSHHGI